MVEFNKKELAKFIEEFGDDLIVTSTPCDEEHSTVYLRRKKVPKAWKSLRFRMKVGESCIPNREAEELKKQTRKWIEQV